MKLTPEEINQSTILLKKMDNHQLRITINFLKTLLKIKEVQKDE